MLNKLSRNNLPIKDNQIASPEGFENIYEFPDSNPLIIVDNLCNIIYSNDQFRKVFGNISSESFLNINSEPNLRFLITSLIESNYNNLQFDLFLPNAVSENSSFNVEAERIKIFDNYYFVLILKTISEKTKLEERINNLHNALEYGKIPVIITDEHGIITYATTPFEKILKAGIELFFKNSIADALVFYLTNEDKKTLNDSVRGKRGWTKTISCVDESGIIQYYELMLNPVFRSENDIVNFILTAHDITSYVSKNLYIQKSERRLKSIINNISDLLFIIRDKDGQHQFENANDNFCKTFSIDKAFALKENIDSILCEELYDAIEIAIDKYNSNTDSFIEFNYNNTNSRHYSVKITSIDDQLEKEVIYIVSMKDITDQVLYQQQLKVAYEKEINLNKLKAAFLENMSHEIRTPLNAIVGYSEMIDDCINEQDYNTIKDLIGSFKEVMYRVLNLYGNIVEVFQIDSGELRLDMVILNVNQVLKSVYNKKKEKAQKKNLNFYLRLNENDLNIKIDWVRFERIINSLVDNAIKYTDSGDVVISSDIINNKVQITIADTGRGIKTDNILSLYEPFVQDEDGYTRKYEGAGLGLTIAYKLTMLMGGKLDINSNENIGTSIVLTFPRSNSRDKNSTFKPLDKISKNPMVG